MFVGLGSAFFSENMEFPLIRHDPQAVVFGRERDISRTELIEANPIRREMRTAAVLPVRIYGIDANGKAFNAMTHTLNVSRSGALLANVEIALNLGDVIGVQKGVYKGKFKVVGIGRKASSSQGQVRIASVEGAKNIWGMDDRPCSPDKEEAGSQRRSLAGGGFGRERRSAARHACDLGVQIRQGNAEVSLWSRCTDISEGGCYLDTRTPLEPGTTIQLTLFLDPENITLPVIVKTAFPGIGMGVQFAFESEDQRIRVRRYVRQRFGEPQGATGKNGSDLVALEKLGECVEQLRAWVKATALDAADREELERLAISLRRELQGLRAEMNERVIERRTQMLSETTSA